MPLRIVILVLLLLTMGLTIVAQTRVKGAKAAGAIEMIVPSPDSVVWIDGIRHGKAADKRLFKVGAINAGRHTIRVRTVGWQDWIKPVIVPAGGTLKLQVTQQKLTNQALLLLQQADAAREAEAHDEAIEAYHQAISTRGGTFPEAYLGLSRSLLARKDYDEAVNAVNKAIRQKPTYAEAHTVMGNILRGQGDYDAAVSSYQKALKLARGRSAEAHTGLALTYKDLEEIPAAIRELELGIQQNADTEPILYYLLGDLYERQNDSLKAIAAYEDYLRLAPDGKLATALRSMIPQMKRDIQTATERP